MASRKAMLDSVVRQISTRLFLQNLLCFLLVDAFIFFFFEFSQGTYILLGMVEFLVLLIFMNQNSKLIRSMLEPLEMVGETADALSGADLSPQDLEQIIGRLDKINVSHLGRRINLPQGSRELANLTRSINAMLERIDQGYQAQARFVSDVSHELRTPISVIQGYANLLNRWGKDDPEARQEAIDAIVQESDSMAQMVEQLLFLVRGDNDTQQVHFEQVDLTGIAEEVARETRLLETGREIVDELEPLVLAQADPRLIKQALRVLVDNAVKYTPRGGRVELSLSARDGLVRMEVTDSGPGIPKEEIGQIFRRFYRADQSRTRQTGGTGLGLPIADWIAHRHRGWIEVTSREGVGSRFSLVFPRKQG
ncbi:MAG: hypothetical protein IJX71_01015 [Oscillospiraceae bacterium]|nr:hypothetical protein [Oscillospiraceae bacterium]